MKCKIEKSRLTGIIVCPSNKSYTHRSVFLASLSKNQSIIENALESADTEATINSCKSFGAEIKKNGSSIVVSKPITFSDSHLINAGNSGTTIRIAASIAALSEARTILTGDESLRKRPMQPIIDALESLGASCTSNDGKPPISIKGKIAGGEVTIPGNISSQFISSLLICAPLTEKGITINIDGELVSKPYLDATIFSMNKFGVNVETVQEYKKYKIKSQQYKGTTFVVPPDYSSLALLLASSTLVGESVSIKAQRSDLPQGDKKFLEILEKMGVEINITDDTILVKSPEVLNGGVFDISDTPDLLPPLSILSLNSSKPLEIVNVKHARYKETDRIAILCKELAKLGIKIKEREDGMVLQKGESLNSAKLDSSNDHRLFMAFCIAGMYVGNCVVTDPESVSVSYPNFISEMKKIGAKLDLV